MKEIIIEEWGFRLYRIEGTNGEDAGKLSKRWLQKRLPQWEQPVPAGWGRFPAYNASHVNPVPDSLSLSLSSFFFLFSLSFFTTVCCVRSMLSLFHANMMKIHLICLFLSASKQQKYPLHSKYPLDYFQFHEKQRTKQSLTFEVQSSKVTDESCEDLYGGGRLRQKDQSKAVLHTVEFKG